MTLKKSVTEKNSVRVYVSKYALTKGIFVVSGKISQNGVLTVQESGHMPTYFCEGEYHLTKEGAVTKARKMIAAKRKAIDKQLVKLDMLETTLDGACDSPVDFL